MQREAKKFQRDYRYAKPPHILVVLNIIVVAQKIKECSAVLIITQIIGPVLAPKSTNCQIKLSVPVCHETASCRLIVLLYYEKRWLNDIILKQMTSNQSILPISWGIVGSRNGHTAQT
jgi:hypothetical protein